MLSSDLGVPIGVPTLQSSLLKSAGLENRYRQVECFPFRLLTLGT